MTSLTDFHTALDADPANRDHTLALLSDWYRDHGDDVAADCVEVVRELRLVVHIEPMYFIEWCLLVFDLPHAGMARNTPRLLSPRTAYSHCLRAIMYGYRRTPADQRPKARVTC